MKVQGEDQDNAAGGTGDGLPSFTTCGRHIGKHLEFIIFYSSFWSLTVSFITGTFSFDDFETELIMARPRSIEEELAACKKQLKVVMNDLMIANQRIQGLSFFFSFGHSFFSLCLRPFDLGILCIRLLSFTHITVFLFCFLLLHTNLIYGHIFN